MHQQVNLFWFLFLSFLVHASAINAAHIPAYAEMTVTTTNCSGYGAYNVVAESCLCDAGYTDFDCSYRQKKQRTAFFLQLFLGYLGGGNFYIERPDKGATQAVLTVASALLVGLCDGVDGRKICLVSGSVGLAATAIWWLTELIQFSLNKIDDANGRSLENNLPLNS